MLHSHKALESMSHHFPGAVHRISSPADLANLDLSIPQHYLLVVQLESVAAAKDPRSTIAANGDFFFLNLDICHYNVDIIGQAGRRHPFIWELINTVPLRSMCYYDHVWNFLIAICQ